VRAVACDPHVAELNIFGFYDDRPRDSGFQAALNRVDGTPRASAEAVHSAIEETAEGCRDSVTPWYPAKRVIGAVAPVWKVSARQVIRFDAVAEEGARVLACLLPGRLGGVVAAAAMARRTAASPGCTAGTTLPSRPARFSLRRSLPLRHVTVAVRLVAESSAKRSRTFSRALK
jgi:hypothetical protein